MILSNQKENFEANIKFLISKEEFIEKSGEKNFKKNLSKSLDIEETSIEIISIENDPTTSIKYKIRGS